MAGRCDATGGRSLCTNQFPPNQGGRSWSAQGLLENQSECLINEAITLASINDVSIKLKRVGEPNNLYLNLLSGSASRAEVIKWEPHSLRVSTHNTVTYKYGHCDRDDVTNKCKQLVGAPSFH